MADVEEDKKPAAKRTSVAEVERTPVDAVDERKPAAKKRAPVDPPADLVPQSDFLNKTVLRPVPLRMVLGDAPEVPMGTGPEQGNLDNDIKRYAITSDRPPTVAKITQFRSYGEGKQSVILDPILHMDMDPVALRKVTSSTPNLKSCGGRNKEFPDLIRVQTNPEKNENLFKIKVNNISSPACPDD